MKIERGCERDSPIPGKWPIGENSQRCPAKMITRQSYEYILAHNMLQNGLLPNAGSYLEQSAKYLEAMSVIDGELAAMREEEFDRIKRKRKS